MSTGELDGGDLIANRDTESPEEVQPFSSEAQTAVTSPEADPPSNPSPAEDGPPDVTSSGAASPEPLLTREDPPASDEDTETKKSPVVLANPVFDEKVEAKIELKEVAKRTVEVGKTEEVVVEKRVVEEK